jgi:hypothetical protein|tara:strand:+ start:10343 stop:10456 length:114 start_codon:yes stop_codon:yes gene_type:complete
MSDISKRDSGYFSSLFEFETKNSGMTDSSIFLNLKVV